MEKTNHPNRKISQIQSCYDEPYVTSSKSKRKQNLLIEKLPTQSQVDCLEIKFVNCIFTYKLKHIETQASKSRRRKIGKSMGYSFRSLRVSYGDNKTAGGDNLFSDCIFNPSDRSIVQEHIYNFEAPKIRFINCKFLRRGAFLKEKLIGIWKNHQGVVVKFMNPSSGKAEVTSELLQLKDLPNAIEFIIHSSD